MHTVSEFCFIIDKGKGREFDDIPAEYIRDLEFADRREIESGKKRDPERHKAYHKLHEYKNVNVLRDIIHKNLEYRDPQFINSFQDCLHQMDLAEKKGQTNFLLPQFLTTGQLSYVIEYP